MKQLFMLTTINCLQQGKQTRNRVKQRLFHGNAMRPKGACFAQGERYLSAGLIIRKPMDAHRSWNRVFPAFRDVLPRFRVVFPAFRDVLPRFRVVLPAFRDVLSRFRVVLPAFRDVFPDFRVVFPLWKHVLKPFRETRIAASHAGSGLQRFAPYVGNARRKGLGALSHCSGTLPRDFGSRIADIGGWGFQSLASIRTCRITINRFGWHWLGGLESLRLRRLTQT
ncbi:hypothetical protein [Methylomonas sp. UP202]|uniref:hypothetical protein n=1 Tax=Methylomonas sp. UP202 TaxID=3040943 RepID=UPI0024783EEC|nr:hypothetical protein [Methylomonas sp. UP202]WGS84222.1 hypothetical protein QC632_14295 [Methylomonas sp. UP202]